MTTDADGAEAGSDDAVHHFWEWIGRLRQRINLSDPGAFLAAVEQFDHEEGTP